ncbi:MAG TPA: glycosyltransferase [Chitinispirillaceae bacterium]|nr:glycosyltransferase [Chitinispirillaceae bacterium]
MNSIQSDIWRGGEKWMVNAASGLAGKGHQVTCIGKIDAVWLEKAARRGLKVISLPIHADFDPFIIWKLYWLFKKEKIDLICCNFEKDVRLGGIAAKIAGVPCIYVRKGLSLIYEKLRYKLAYLHIVDRIITPAYFIKQNFRQFSWLNQDNIDVIHNGVEIPDTMVFSKEKLRTITGIAAESQIILGAGNLHPQKGFQYLIEALKILHQSGKKPHLVITGGGDETPYRAISESCGITEYVHFTGHRDDVRELMFGADVFVLSSIDEGLPNVVLEAMSVGTPVVAALAGGTDEIVNDGIDGFTVPVKDSLKIAEKTGVLLDDENLRAKFGTAGLNRVKKNFTMEVMVDSLNEIFVNSVSENMKNKTGSL